MSVCSLRVFCIASFIFATLGSSNSSEQIASTVSHSVSTITYPQFQLDPPIQPKPWTLSLSHVLKSLQIPLIKHEGMLGGYLNMMKIEQAIGSKLRTGYPLNYELVFNIIDQASYLNKTVKEELLDVVIGMEIKRLGIRTNREPVEQITPQRYSEMDTFVQARGFFYPSPVEQQSPFCHDCRLSESVRPTLHDVYTKNKSVIGRLMMGLVARRPIV